MNEIYILDTCVFVKEGFLIDTSNIYICPYLVETEAKSPKAKMRLDCMRGQGILEFIQPLPECIKKAQELEIKLNEKSKKLSKTDIDVIALGLHFKEKDKKICIITDDGLMQKICKKNKINCSGFFN
ncbi:MAG: hypothetical protein B6U87_01965 [Candidatus Aenigmarchaeota archaeon ex4484_52]|nr:MAG: hypothetical protein B6U87_01965 [Candidatus Aenigmarchaeota archaeon ex4484_52]